MLSKRDFVALAKQRLMNTYRLTEPQAHHWIQKQSMDTRKPLVAVARKIVTMERLP